MVSKWKFVMLAVFMAVIGPAAYGGSFDYGGTVTLDLYGAYDWGNGALGALGTITLGANGPNPITTANVCTGQYVLQLDEKGLATGTGSALLAQYGPSGILPSFCADASQDAPVNWTTDQPYYVLSMDQWVAALKANGNVTITSTQETCLEELFGTYGSQANLDNDHAAAFQLCVWEIMNDTPGSYSLTSGSFQVSGYDNEVMNILAKPWLSSINLGTGLTLDTDMTVLYNADLQDYAFSSTSFNPDIGNVPEPVTMFGVLLGVGALGRYWSRKRANS